MNDSEFNNIVSGFIVACLIALVIGIGIGASCERAEIRREAHKSGAGEYYFNADGVQQFRWKGPNDE